MHRRTFLTGATLVSSGFSGCIGEATSKNIDHEEALRAEIDERGVSVQSMDLTDDTITVEYLSEITNEDLAKVAMAFVERIEEGWEVEQLNAIARQNPDLAWYAKTLWAKLYLDGEITAGGYGDRINETVSHTVVVGDSNETGTARELSPVRP